MAHRTIWRNALCLLLTLGGLAHAQIFRAYLDPSGNDSHPCTLSQPCRLLPAAIAAVASGGEIWLLDSANYNSGPVAVTKSVTILAVPGAVGSVVALGGDAFVVSTGGVKLALRNLVIVPFPAGGGTNGINVTAGAELTIEGCLIANLPQSGVVVGTAAKVQITDTTLRGNGDNGIRLQGGARATVTRATISGNSNSGVLVSGSVAGTLTTADIADSTLDANGRGVFAWSQNASAVLKVSVRDSRAVRNDTEGLAAQSDAAAAVTLSASSNMISNNGTGLAAYSTGTKVLATGNTVSDNGIGLKNTGALLESAGSNGVRNNTSNTSGAITQVSPI